MQAAKHVSGLLAFDAALMSAYQSSENTEDVGLLSYEQLVRHYPARFGSWQEEKALETTTNTTSTTIPKMSLPLEVTQELTHARLNACQQQQQQQAHLTHAQLNACQQQQETLAVSSPISDQASPFAMALDGSRAHLCSDTPPSAQNANRRSHIVTIADYEEPRKPK